MNESKQIRKNRRPLYLSIAQTLRSNIDGGKYAAGDFLPSERELSQLFDVSRITIRKALTQLTDEHIIVSHGRSGYEILPTNNLIQKGNSSEVDENKTSQELLLALPFYSNHFHGNKLVEALERSLVHYPYKLILRNTQENPSIEIDILKSLDTKTPSNILLLPSALKQTEYKFDFSQIKKKANLIFLDRYVLGVSAPYVGSQNIEAIRDAVIELYELGHRRIAFVGYKGNSSEYDRYFGYKMALDLCGLDFNKDFASFETELKSENTHYGVVGKRSVEKFFSLKNPPTAIITINDFVGSGVYSALKEKHISVPEEVSLIGFDDDPIAQAMIPGGMTTYCHQYDQLVEALLTVLTSQEKLHSNIGITIPACQKRKSTIGPPNT